MRFAAIYKFKTGITRILALASGRTCHHETNRF